MKLISETHLCQIIQPDTDNNDISVNQGVHRLIEASAELIVAKDMQRGLEKAKEAGKGTCLT